MAIDYTERIDSGDYTIDGVTGKWTGWRRFQSSVSNLTANLAAARALAWSVNSLSMTPRAVRVVPDDPECPKTALIVARYETSEDPYHFVAGRGYMSVTVEAVPARAKLVAAPSATPVSADYVEGETAENLAMGWHWKVVEGTNICYGSKTIVRVSTAYAASGFAWSTYAALVGKKNSDACAKILNAAAGELLMLGVEVPRGFDIDSNNAIVPVVFTMLYRKNGLEKDAFGKALMVLRHQRVPQESYILHPSDTGGTTRYWMNKDGSALPGTVEATRDKQPDVTTNAKTRIAYIDKATGARASRTILEAAAFADVNNLVYWSA